VVCRRLRLFCVLLVVLPVAAPVPLTQAASLAVGKRIIAALHSLSLQASAPQNVSNTQAPVGTEASRLSVLMGETRDVPLPVPMTSVLVVSPEIASAVLSGRGLTLTGLQVGETMMFAFDGARRFTLIIQVVGRTYANTHKNAVPIDPSIELSALSGSYSLSYSAPSGGAPALFRQSFEFHQKLSQGRTLRFSSDAFKFIGQGDQNRLRATAFGLGFNRLSLGIDSTSGSVDILDSQINISLLSFNGYTMRGLHVVSTSISPLRGVEFFAGFARPSQSLFEINQGRMLGMMVPVARGESWRVRAGVFYLSPGKNNNLGSGGTVWQMVGRYAPNKNVATEGEVAYASRGLSWRGRLDLQSKHMIGFGEILRFDRRSPLVSIGAQGGGRRTQAFGMQWLASSRFNVSFNINHTAVVPPVNAGRATFDRTTLFANANYRLNPKQQVSFHFAEQQIEIGAPVGGSRLRLDTQTVRITHDLHFNQSWSNNISASLTTSREARANEATDSGLVLNDQLRFSFKRGSATGFVNYANQKQSLVGLIVRNPTLLPPLLQPVFAADPVLFLQQNRDILGLLLPGVELPQTRGVDAGLRIQRAFARVNLASEVRYSAGEILGRNQRTLLTSVNLDMHLDAANSLQVSGSRLFGINSPVGQSVLTITYIHRFGAGSGGGLQFSRLLGLERGVIEGRVFFDSNGDGQDDANEPGIAGMKVEMDSDRSTTTDDSGRFHFKINSGVYHIAVVSDDLGVRWRASTTTEQHGFLSARQTVNVSFGLTNYGSVAGRVFNDVTQKGEQTAGSMPGVAGVQISLHPMNAGGTALSLIADGSGAYQFRNMPPGSYTLKVDPGSLPADFRVPQQTSWAVVVKPLQNSYLDIPLSAQRAVSGVVFVDKDGDGKFDAEKDEPVEGARVLTGDKEVITGKGGTYVLRDLTFGRMEVRARAPWGAQSAIVTIELGEAPIRRKGVNLLVER
jgi:SdrD B-like domain/Pilus formation protein N terminal region